MFIPASMIGRAGFNALTDIAWQHAGWADDPDWTKPDDGLNLFGSGGSYAETPDAAALDITGDIEIIWNGALADYTPAIIQHFVSKWVATNNNSYSFRLTTAGNLQFVYSTTGANAVLVTQAGSSLQTVSGIADGDRIWTRVTVDVDNGSSQSETKFYYSLDPKGTNPGSVTWTQIGSTVIGSVFSIFSGTSTLRVGFLTGFNMTGITYRSVVRSGIGGTIVFNADFTGKNGTSSFTESSSNAATVTLGTTAVMGQMVRTWRNAISPSESPFQTDVTLLPEYIPTSVSYNNKATVYFANDFLNYVCTNIPTGWTMVLVGNFANTASRRMMGTGNNGARGFGIQSTGPDWYVNGNVVLTGGTPDTNTHLMTTRNSTSAGDIWVDGTRVASGSSGNAVISSICLGAGYNGTTTSNPLNGNIAFWAIYSGDFTADPKYTEFKAWVASYYGLTVA